MLVYFVRQAEKFFILVSPRSLTRRAPAASVAVIHGISFYVHYLMFTGHDIVLRDLGGEFTFSVLQRFEWVW